MTIFRITKMLRLRHLQTIYHFEGESPHNMEVVQTKQDRPSISQYSCPKGRIMHISFQDDFSNNFF